MPHLSLNMKFSLFVLVCSGLLALVASFTKEDHEIFRLRDEIEASEGPEVTFYGNYLTHEFLHIQSCSCWLTSF